MQGLNLIQFNVAQAREAKADEPPGVCYESAKYALARSRGLPKHREQQKKEGTWVGGLSYRTRSDGALAEDAVFAGAAAYGKEALALDKACGGPAGLATPGCREPMFGQV